MDRKWAPVCASASGVAMALAIVLWPGQAHAWGALAHLEFARTALVDAPGLTDGLRRLLADFTDEYLYGALAADIIVGKNLAPYAVHAHNWRVGFRVLSQTEGDPQRAFAWGYLAHLAVDTIAHNYYVPYRTAISYDRRRTGHAYWELRYDQQLDPELWQVARRVTSRAQRDHDHFLKEALAGAYRLPFAVSRRFFETLLISARLKRWQSLSRMLAGEREMPIAPEEIAEMQQLAVEQVRGLLAQGEAAPCVGADPTGLRNLRLGRDLRRRFQAARRAGASAEALAPALVALRGAFRSAVHGPLNLPDLSGLPS